MNDASRTSQPRVTALQVCAMGLAVAIAAPVAMAQDAPANFSDAVAKGKPILEFRPRYESVDQSGRREDGEAFTSRINLGWETASWKGMKFLIEFQDVRQLGDESYDSNVNGKTTFAQVFDPDVTELNRLQVMIQPDSRHTITLGRQRMNIDDQRFVGGVLWRQDEQTFDAARIDADYGRFDVTYAYIAHVNRIFAEAQDWGSDSHIATATYTFAEPLKVEGFLYALDITKPAGAANQSSRTAGVKAFGKQWLGAWKIDYAASYAQQSEYGASTLSFDLDHYNFEASATLGPVTGRLNYESLSGDGRRGFTTPLATLHAFNGWSDAFIVNGVKTTVDGLVDMNATITWAPRWKWDYLFNLAFLARYHDFEAERTGADLGKEINLQATGMVTPKFSWLVKYADYDGPGTAPAPADRNKFWVGFEWKL